MARGTALLVLFESVIHLSGDAISEDHVNIIGDTPFTRASCLAGTQDNTSVGSARSLISPSSQMMWCLNRKWSCKWLIWPYIFDRGAEVGFERSAQRDHALVFDRD